MITLMFYSIGYQHIGQEKRYDIHEAVIADLKCADLEKVWVHVRRYVLPNIDPVAHIVKS
jgi:hypothetical protein